jgi:heme-degrading monooxygenase HmoA
VRRRITRGGEIVYARVVRGEIPTDRLDEAIRLWQESVGPSAKRQSGFRGARLMVDRNAGKVLSIGLWESEPKVWESVGWNQEQIAKFAALFSGPPTVEEDYELAAEI